MDIPEKLMQYRYHVSIAVVVSAVISLVLYAAPRLLAILAYFWPLFASTTVFLVAIIAFGSLSQFATQTQGEKTDEDQILDCVQGPPIHTHEEPQKFEQT
ncbi:hypothetical protein I3843_10G077700 [Carya illinoinensis]|nr:hypothetical protein I3843_10G077700 [Carya illinoinensis]